MNNVRKWSRTAVAGVALLAGGFVVGVTQAATLTVNTVTDETAASETESGNGQCSLRAAVTAINDGANAGGCENSPTAERYGVNDTINLPAGTYDLTIPQAAASPHEYGEYSVTESSDSKSFSVSMPPDNPDNPYNSQGDLDIEKSVTIVGAEPGATIQAGTGFNDRILHIYAPSGTVDVTLQNLTIKGGTSPLNDEEVGTDISGNPWNLRIQGGGIATGIGATAYNTATSGSETNGSGTGGSGGSGGVETGATYMLTLDHTSVIGNAAGDGGGLYSTATLTAYQSTLSDNTATANGGGLYNDAAMTMVGSTLNGNQAEGGGGFFDTGSHNSLVVGSTISRNIATGGGGISSRSLVTLTLVDSTVSDNQANDTGGGIYTNGNVKMYFDTVANNTVAGETGETETDTEGGTGAGGAGINTFGSGVIELSNTLLADNMVGTTIANCGASGGANTTANLVDDGYNLDSGTSCDLHAGGDLSNIAPQIGTLGLNGGLTETNALLSGSPAINAGSIAGVPTFTVLGTSFNPAAIDQRGIARNNTPDIGAYEVFSAPVVPSTGGGTGTTSSGGGGGGTIGVWALLALGGLGFAQGRRRP